MCAIFGLLDYKGKLTAAQRLRIIKALGAAAEVRGTDATGIAFFQREKLCIQKAARPAHRMKYRLPAEVRFIMGHTRMTTQGSAEKNRNNHPFPGKAGGRAFALAHNGILTNDHELRYSKNLPKTDIETDSYVAVQLIEKQKEVSPGSLRSMAEAVRGHFTFTVLDQDNNLYFIKGENPLTIFHYPERGFYLYASTEEILAEALGTLKMEPAQDIIWPYHGEILRINSRGQQEEFSFHVDEPCVGFLSDCWPVERFGHVPHRNYIEALKTVAAFHGLEGDCIDALLEDGCTIDEIEDFIYCREVWR